MVIGPEILDVDGNAMDIDDDLVPGEIPEDRYEATFTLVPDLAVTYASATVAVHAGNPLSIDWIVKNRSGTPTAAPLWTD